VQHLAKLQGSPKVGSMKAALDAANEPIIFPEEAKEDEAEVKEAEAALIFCHN